MEDMGTILSWVGFLIALLGSLWMLIEAFRSGILWGIACLLIPFINLIWLVTHWEEGKASFLIILAGWAVVIVGIMLGGRFELLNSWF